MKGKGILKKFVAFAMASIIGIQSSLAYADEVENEKSDIPYVDSLEDDAEQNETQQVNYIDWLNNIVGQPIKGDGECPTLIYAYINECFGRHYSTHNGVNVARTVCNDFPDLFTFVEYSPTMQLKIGDIVSFEGATYGHVGIVLGVEGDKFYMADQWSSTSYIHRQTIYLSNGIYGSSGQYKLINAASLVTTTTPDIDPAVLSVKAGTNKTNTDFSWTSTETDVNFDVVIYKDKLWEGDPALRTNVGSNHSFSCLLAPGKYCAYIDTIRNDTGVLLMSNVVEFTVTIPKYDYTIENIDQAETALYLIYNQNENTVRAGRTKRQMIEYLLTSSDYAVFGGANWPVGINDYTDTITDNGLAAIDGTTTIKLDSSSRAQISFGWFASGVVYTQDISHTSARCSKIMDNPGAGNYTVDYVRNHFKQKLQAGEHIRIDELCSLTFVSCDDNGFYWLEYGSDDGSDAHIRMRYASYDTFVSWVNSTGRAMWHYYVDLTDNTPHSISNANISVIENQRYSGKEITPEVTVTYNGRTLKKNVDYTVSYANNINAGTASVTVTGIGAFTGSTTSNFTIDRLSIYYAQLQRFLTKEIYYNGSPCTVPIILVYNGTTLTEGKDYTVKFTNNVNVGTAGIYIDGIGNFCDTRTQAFPILSKNINQCTVNADLSDKNHTSKPITPAVSVFDPERNCELINGVDFSLEYTNNIEPGTASIIIKGINNYSGNVVLNFNIKKPVLSAPTITKIASNGSNVSLEWNSVSGATSYRVFRAESANGAKTRVKTVDTLGCTDTTVTSGKTYYYFVAAYDSKTGRLSAYSEAKSVKVQAVIAAPVITSATSNGTSVSLKWNAVTDATSYRIYRADRATGAKTLVKTVGTLYGTDTNVTAGKTYYYFVAAYDSKTGRLSAYSEAKSVKVQAAIAAPVITKITSNDTSVRIEWEAVADATSYRVYRADSKTGAKKLVKTVGTLYCTDTTATAGKTYYYFVAAYDSKTGRLSVYSEAESIIV